MEDYTYLLTEKSLSVTLKGQMFIIRVDHPNFDKAREAVLAEDWDNVGLLLGDRKASATRVMTCLTVTPETVAEALNREVELIVTHHPFVSLPDRV